jgi:hypothetical protein
MCTVSFIAHKHGYFLTSNRDEKKVRGIASKPQVYHFKNNRLIFPKDKNANGTWILLKQNGDSLCLLNGAFENKIPEQVFPTSRGQIVLQIASKENMLEAFSFIDLAKTAPFTLIIVCTQKLYECKWDGTNKNVKALNFVENYIWSSVTLYDLAQQEKRQTHFKNFIQALPCPSSEDIIHFHLDRNITLKNEKLLLNCTNYTTVSTTCINVTLSDAEMQYFDLLNNNTTLTNFN